MPLVRPAHAVPCLSLPGTRHVRERHRSRQMARVRIPRPLFIGCVLFCEVPLLCLGFLTWVMQISVCLRGLWRGEFKAFKLSLPPRSVPAGRPPFLCPRLTMFGWPHLHRHSPRPSWVLGHDVAVCPSSAPRPGSLRTTHPEEVRGQQGHPAAKGSRGGPPCLLRVGAVLPVDRHVTPASASASWPSPVSVPLRLLLLFLRGRITGLTRIIRGRRSSGCSL